ncbi:molybdopterin-containing oxidoreductase family protein [Novosphingobium aquimarinum]|uniref:molybdopterin-containing oxidoreductase family protein n=1 Tax=Novosphingobium aquimarinum TaxID=2682494 RepID=UPI0012EB6DC3|nr:molybdopterin-dependent oxidoreductase [Novosphingobium aquimarinum]
MREALSFCRICPGYCGLVLTIDEDERIVDIRGDKAHPLSDGFACIKGLQSAHLYHGPQRLLHPLKRNTDGGHERITATQAIDEIAERMRTIATRHGLDAVAFFKGGNVYQNTLPSIYQRAFIEAFGSRSLFTNNTIDQSAKAVSADRLGSWHAGRNHFAIADVMMIVGGNPMVSISMFGFDAYNPVKKLKAFKARGGKLIVIDPRRSETAQFADIFLQPRPGEDVTIAAAMIRTILENGWLDGDFCDRHVAPLEDLRRAVAPFTLEYAELRADVPADLLLAATKMLATSKHGFITTGTGPSMAPRSNLMQHLFDSIDVLCGHFLREGDRVPHPGLMKKREWRAQVVPAGRCWEKGPRSRVRGLGLLYGEKMTGAIAQEITTPGEGQVKALLVDGGNPASSVADQRRVVEAFKSLELLVTVDPEMTETAQLAHYILPPKLQFEHPNMVGLLEHETSFHQRPVQQFVEAAIAPPSGSDLVDDWRVYYALAQRLGLQLCVDDVPLDMVVAPTPEEMFSLLFRNGNVTFEEIRQHPRGKIFDVQQTVLAADPAEKARFDIAPTDVLLEIEEVFSQGGSGPQSNKGSANLDLLLISRRLREVFNSAGRTSPRIRGHQPYNAAYMHPELLARYGLAAGDRIRITSAHGAVIAIAQGDGTLRDDVVSMAHGWGGLPDSGAPEENGVSVGLLISTESDFEVINAMPRQSAIPVRVEHARAHSEN